MLCAGRQWLAPTPLPIPLQLVKCVEEELKLPAHLQLHFAFMVQDGLAHKQRWSLKGDAGSRFCALFKNCFTHGKDDDMLSPVNCWTKVSQLEMTQSQNKMAWDRVAGRAFSSNGSRLLAAPCMLKLCWLTAHSEKRWALAGNIFTTGCIAA